MFSPILLNSKFSHSDDLKIIDSVFEERKKAVCTTRLAANTFIIPHFIVDLYSIVLMC